LCSHDRDAVDRAGRGGWDARGEEASSELLDLLAKCVYADRVLDAGGDEVVFNDLGRRKLKQVDRQCVAAVLLRILAANPHAIPESVLRGYFREFIESLPERLVAALDLPRDTLEHGSLSYRVWSRPQRSDLSNRFRS
jgi:hypothetical protein